MKELPPPLWPDVIHSISSKPLSELISSHKLSSNSTSVATAANETNPALLMDTWQLEVTLVLDIDG